MKINETIGKLKQRPILFVASILTSIFALLIMVVSVSYLITGSVPGLPQPEVAATVNGEKILKKDYQSLYDSQKYYFETIYTKELKQEKPTQLIAILPNTILDNLIQETLLKQYLAKKGITISDAEVKQQIKTQIVDQQDKGDWQAYEKELKEKYHATLSDRMHTFRTRLMTEKVIKTDKLTIEEFDTWYGKLKEESTIQVVLKEYKK